MNDNITSNNQNGGITAKTVNINGEVNIGRSNKRGGKKLFPYIVGIFTIIGAIVAILGYKGVKKDKNQDEKNIFNVTSHNQQGGITAGEVNIGNTPRTFNQKVTAALQARLPSEKSKTIVITAVLGDQEAFQFAEQIKEYLLSQGWKVDGVNQAAYSRPVVGQIIQPKPDGGIEIIIGGKQ